MNKKIKALETLRRVEEAQLDQLAQNLVALRGRQFAAQSRFEALGARAIVEARAEIPEGLPYVGRFLAGLRAEQSREAAVAAALDGEIEILREDVAHHFKTERSFARLAQEARDAVLAERTAKAEAALEDMISARFGRV